MHDVASGFVVIASRSLRRFMYVLLLLPQCFCYGESVYDPG